MSAYTLRRAPRLAGILFLVLIAEAIGGAGSAQATMSVTPASGMPQTNAGATVNTVAVAPDGTTVYVGGDFTTFGNLARNNLAAFDLSSGQVLAWNPNPNSTAITDLAMSGNDVVVAGNFTQIGTVVASLSNVAKLDASGGALSWNPRANGTVSAIAQSGSTTYIGGNFTQLGTRCTSTLGAALALSTGNCNTAMPTVSGGSIRAVAADGTGGWYIGGDFNTVAGQSRSYIAHILANGSLDTSFSPNAGGTVRALAVSASGSTVYVGGDFFNIGGQGRDRIAALNATNGNATNWNPSAQAGNVYALALSSDGNTVYAGGDFFGIAGQSRNRIAALDANTDTNNATGWNPDVNGTVRVLAVSGSTVYAGGDFTAVDQSGTPKTRNRIAALDTTQTTNTATAWDPSAGNSVHALAVSGSTVYAGGDFINIGGQSRSRIAALDASITTNNATAWDPNSGGSVYALAASGSTVYAGGSFSTIGGKTRYDAAGLDANTNTNNATGWNPNAPSGAVRALAISGSTLYAGGDFTAIGGQSRQNVAAVGASGDGTDWAPDALGGTVNAFAVVGSTVYAGGSFTQIGGQNRNRIAALDSSGNATTWDPVADNAVNALVASGSTVYAGGDFTNVGGAARNRIAALETNTNNATAWNPNANNSVNALALSGSDVYVGGAFSNVGGATRNYLARVDTNGSAAAWVPNPSGNVNALALAGSDLVAGGSFAEFGFGAGVVADRGLAVFRDIVAPANTVAPSLTGEAKPKSNLTCNKGSWSSAETPTYSYRWYRDGLQIGQALGNTYTVTSDDQGSSLYCAVTATNSAGSTDAQSDSVQVPPAATSADQPVGGNSGDEVGAPNFRARVVSDHLGRVLRSGRLNVKFGSNGAGAVNYRVLTTGIRQLRLAAGRFDFESAGSSTSSLRLNQQSLTALRRIVREQELRRVMVRVVLEGAEPTVSAASRFGGILRYT